MPNRTSAWVFSCEFAAYFQSTFLKNTSGGLFVTNVFGLSRAIAFFKTEVIQNCTNYELAVFEQVITAN